MLLRIAKHEWRTLTADATLLILLLVFVLAIGYGVMNGARWVQFQRQSIAQTVDEEARRFMNLKNQVREIEAGRMQAPFTNPVAPDAAGAGLH